MATDPNAEPGAASASPQAGLSIGDGGIYKHLCRAFADPTSNSEQLTSALRILLAITHGAGAAITFPSESEPAQVRVLSRQALDWSKDLPRELTEHAGDALAAGQFSQVNINPSIGLWLLSQPMAERGACLQLLLIAEQQEIAPFAVVAQMMAACIALNQRSQAETSPADFFALEDLTEQVGAAPSRRDAATLVAGKVSDYLEADFGLVAERRGGDEFSVVSLSQPSELDPRGLLHDRLVVLCNAVADANGCLAWQRGQQSNNADHDRCFENVAAEMDFAEMACYFSEHEPTGTAVVIVFGWRQAAHEPRARSLIGSASTTVLAGFFAHMHLSPSHWSVRLEQVWKKLRSRTALLSVSLIVLVCAWPVDFDISADVTVQPQLRRFVSAPFSGVLAAAKARPGDQIATGDVLALMDGEELQIQLDEIRAELAKAENKYNQSLSGGDGGSIELARLDLDKIRARLELLEYRYQSLEIVSPINGVVVVGDLDRAQGVPVERGESLFELGALETIEFELNIAEADIAYVEAGAAVEITFSAVYDRVWQGQLERIYPRARLIDGASYFLATLSVDNENDRLRPGMVGDARIKVRRAPAIWVAARRPLEVFRAWWAL